MKYLLVLGSLLLLSVSYGDGLRCYHCEKHDTPCMSSLRTCSLPHEQCYKGESTLMGQPVYEAGCIASDRCNKSTPETVVGLPVTLTASCCTTDLCNGHPDVPANGLQCYHCPASQTPCQSRAYMCTGANTQCLTRVTEAAGVRFTETGCAVPHDCKMNVDQTILGQTVSVKYSCCSTNLCNAAPGVRMPLVTGAALAFAWLAYLV
ncbi:urokinase plasminogen activator surface receptor [Callorhinchus milii]|uniref:urokinase plasminogen activator surface receptor n=1 Tax=Callorhinchus milii TaxID=7868 RepID=UPI001C3F7435|nr:urokinase plasminogen activator surface receptor [Callorhinchus milii]